MKNPKDTTLINWSNLISQSRIHWHHVLSDMMLCERHSIIYVVVLTKLLFTWIFLKNIHFRDIVQNNDVVSLKMLMSWKKNSW